MRKVYVNVLTRIIITQDDGVDTDDVLSEMDYNFTSKTDGADIVETEIRDVEVIDSK